jgi:hypothetical protein
MLTNPWRSLPNGAIDRKGGAICGHGRRRPEGQASLALVSESVHGLGASLVAASHIYAHVEISEHQDLVTFIAGNPEAAGTLLAGKHGPEDHFNNAAALLNYGPRFTDDGEALGALINAGTHDLRFDNMRSPTTPPTGSSSRRCRMSSISETRPSRRW